MLVQNVKGNHEEIRLGAADRLVTIDAQEPQEDFLHQVLYVGGSMAQTGAQEPTQPLSVLSLQVRNKGALIA
jgi:hypothetical protein